MVGLLLGRDLVFGALLAAADDVVGDLEGVKLDPLHVGGLDRVRGAQLEQRLDRRLRVDLGVEALEDRASDRFEVLVLPVDLETVRRSRR